MSALPKCEKPDTACLKPVEMTQSTSDPLVMTNIAMEAMAIEIMSFPIKKDDVP